MPRQKENPIRLYFDIDYEKSVSMYKLTGCGKVFNYTHAGNLESHVERNHKTQFAEFTVKKEKSKAEKIKAKNNLVPEPKKIRVAIDRPLLFQACTELVTVNGRPFNLLEDSGLQKILKPLIVGLGGNFAINAENIRSNIIVTANGIKNQIREEIRGRLVSIKADSITRLDRSTLGINL